MGELPKAVPVFYASMHLVLRWGRQEGNAPAHSRWWEHLTIYMGDDGLNSCPSDLPGETHPHPSIGFLNTDSSYWLVKGSTDKIP